jgi:AcrR family transcriptional regulator
MTEKNRMNAEERKQAIINAAKPLFAKKGFNGVSVRDIAKAADVSEALLYRHFPSKEAMYKDILDYSGRLMTISIEEMKKTEPGVEVLIHLVYTLFQVILFEVPGKVNDQRIHERLLFYSLLENADFAKIFFKKIYKSFYDIMEINYQAGLKSGDIIRINIRGDNLFWFLHHLAMGLNICHLFDKPAFSYKGSKEEMVEDAIKFVLRGAGVTEKAINDYMKSENKMSLIAKIKKM